MQMNQSNEINVAARTEFQSDRNNGACYSIGTLGTKAFRNYYSWAAENYTEKEKQTETEGRRGKEERACLKRNWVIISQLGL